MRNSLGNLLPLSTPKNASLSNRPFPEKKSGVKGIYVGYVYGSYAENEVALLDHWTPQQILTRGIKMLTFMERRWQISFGGEEEKVGILVLEFLLKEQESATQNVLEFNVNPTSEKKGVNPKSDKRKR